MNDRQQQRVNIQYSVKVEEVPELVTRLLSEAVDRLQEISVDTNEMYSEVRKQAIDFENYSFGASKIDHVRRALADIDYRLADCGAMLQGMSRMDAQAEQPQQQPISSDALEAIQQAAAATAQANETMAGSDEGSEHE